MNIEITFRNTQSTDAIRERVLRRFAKVVKHMREPVEAHMVLRVERHRHIAEISVNAAGDTFQAHEETEDMYASIDRLMHKLARAARRHKERQQDRQHARGPQLDGFAWADAVREADGEAIEEPMNTEEIDAHLES
jgi:putative sigma-54 modulation protein